MADTGPQSDDSTQSFVVRTWQEPCGNLRGTVRHVQSQTRRGFTRLSQAQKFIEQSLARPGSAPAPSTRPVTPRSLKWAGLPRRRFLMAASALAIVAAAGMVVIASVNVNLPAAVNLGSAVGPGLTIEVILALFIGLVLGCLGSAVWLRRNRRC